jgi:hypothetical protein
VACRTQTGELKVVFATLIAVIIATFGIFGMEDLSPPDELRSKLIVSTIVAGPAARSSLQLLFQMCCLGDQPAVFRPMGLLPG